MKLFTCLFHFIHRQHISPPKETCHYSYTEIMDNTYLTRNKILGTTIIILTHVVRIHAFISSNQIKELSVYTFLNLNVVQEHFLHQYRLRE